MLTKEQHYKIKVASPLSFVTCRHCPLPLANKLRKKKNTDDQAESIFREIKVLQDNLSLKYDFWKKKYCSSAVTQWCFFKSFFQKAILYMYNSYFEFKNY